MCEEYRDSLTNDPLLPQTLQGDEITQNNKYSPCRREMAHLKKMRLNFRHDVQFRKKAIYTLFMLFSYFLDGWTVAQNGPALLDFQKNTGVTFSLASLYATIGYVGAIPGSLTMGHIHGKCNALYFHLTVLTGLAISQGVIPWCSSFGSMLTMQMMNGFFAGSLDSLVIAEVSALWGEDAQSPLQAVYFVYGFGAILSPLCVAPFLSNSESTHINTTQLYPILSVNNDNDSLVHMAQSHPSNYTIQFKNFSILHEQTQKYFLYIPFTISVGIVTLTAIPYLILLTYGSNNWEYKTALKRRHPHITTWKKCRLFINIGICTALIAAIENACGDLLGSFTVSHLNWNKQDGSFLTALFRTSIAIGGFMGVVETVFLGSGRMLICHILAVIVLTVGFLMCSFWNINAGVWLLGAVIGLPMAVLTPSLVYLTEERYFPVSGKIAAFFITMQCTGASLCDALLGYLMERISPLSFPVVLLVEICLLFLVILLLVWRK